MRKYHNTEARKYLLEFLNEWRNEYLTVPRYAEHHGLTTGECNILLDLARIVESHPHPDE